MSDAVLDEKKSKKRVRSPVHDQISRKTPAAEKNPLSNEQVASFLQIIASSPEDTVRKLARASGFPHHAMEMFLRRMKTSHGDLKQAVQALGRRELIQKLNEKVAQGLDFMDDFAWAGMNARDIAIAISIMIEKVQLLEGRPTVIMSFEEREHLSSLLPAYVREAKRRGIMIDEHAVEVIDEIRPKVLLPDEVKRETIDRTYRYMPDAESEDK